MCFFCKCPSMRPSTATHVVDFDGRAIIVRNVPCMECEQCGEKYFSDEVMEKLDAIVSRLREFATEFAVTDYNAA